MDTSTRGSSSKKPADGGPGAHPTVAILRRLALERKGAVGAACLLIFVLVALFGPWFAPYNPVELHLDAQLAPPSARFWWGTDELGRDILSRVIYGARVSLQAGILAVGLAGVIGVSAGLVSGYLGGAVDVIISRIWDTLLAFPAIFLAIGIVTISGPGYLNAVLAVAIINLPTFARLVRAATITMKERDFVEAARAVGAPTSYIMFRTILPNCLSLVVVQMAIAVPAAILVEASLSFLGLGSQPPAPSWGNMLTTAQSYLYRSPTYGIFPGVALTFVVIGLNYFADGLQDAIDPRRIRAGARVT
jgi:ABC-type dipeptide/oligopeptide/nickel transport system permease subunit